MKKRCQSCERTHGPGTQSCPVCGRTLVLAEGSVVGRYRIVRPIATGGMSQVYLARQKGPIERDVALKVVSIPANADDRAAVDALRNEAFLAGRVSNPHIVTVFDHGEIDGGDLYLAMEFLRGYTLAETLARSGGMDYVRALRIGAQIGEALVAIHEAGLVHRDLKPANIFLVQTEGAQDFVKLLDFGICIPARPTLRSAFSGGRTAGTPLYMSPEQVRGRGVDARSDLYALGAITYELLVGEPPFTGPDVWEAHLSAVPVPISIAKRNVRIPRGLDDLLLRLLSKTPEQRPRSAREVVDRFRQILPSRSGNGRGPEGVRESVPVEDRGWFEAGPRTLLLRDPTYVERRKEPQILRDALGKASSGWGGIIWLVGEEGSGKTTLGTKFLEVAGEAGFRTASATAATHASMMGAWRAAVGQLLGVSDRTKDQVREAVVLLAATATAGRTPNPLVEGVMDLLYPGPAAFGLLRSDREAFSDYLAASVEHVLWLLARQSRIALHIDDFHMAGSPSCAFLDRFRRAMEVAPAPIVLLLTSRPPTRDEEQVHVFKAAAGAREKGELARLSRLADREIDQLVDSMCPAPCDAGVHRLVRRAAAGNPLFAVQMCRHLGTSGAIRLSDGLVRQVAGADTAVPPALMDLLAARIDGLRRQPPDGALAADLVARIAVLGQWAALDTVFAMCDMEGRRDLCGSLDVLVDRLVQEGFLTRVPWAEDDFLVLAHPVMGDAVMSDAHDYATARLHLFAAQVLEKSYADDPGRVAADLGEHYFAAGFFDRATDYLLMAGEAVLEDSRFRDARALFLKAETCLERMGLPSDPRAGRVLLALIEILFAGGEFSEARQRLALLRGRGQIDTSSPEGLRAIELQARLAEALREHDEARAILEGLIKLCLERNDRHRAANAMLRLAEIRMIPGDNAGAHALVRSAEDLVRQDGDTRTMGLIHLMYGRIMRKMGSADEAFSHIDKALAILTDPRDFAERAEALFFHGAKLHEMERWGECAEVFREGVRLCEQTGFARGLAGHLTNLGSCLIALSRIEEGREAVVRALAIREQMGDSMGVAQCLTALAHLALVNKDWRNARDLSQKALSLNRRIGYVLGERVALLNLGKALTGLDSPDEAERQFQACLLTAGRDRALTPAIGYAHQAIADLIEARGDREAALRHRLNAIVVFDKLEMYDRSERIRQMLGRPTPGVPLTASPARPERPTPRNTRPAAGRTTKPLPATGRTPTGRTSAAGGRPSGPRVTPISTTAVKSPEGGDGRGSDSRSPL